MTLSVSEHGLLERGAIHLVHLRDPAAHDERLDPVFFGDVLVPSYGLLSGREPRRSKAVVQRGLLLLGWPNGLHWLLRPGSSALEDPPVGAIGTEQRQDTLQDIAGRAVG